jgi:hypothetical protein
MKRIEDRILGYLFDGDLYCPLCFPDFGRVSPDEIVFRDSFDAHFGKCHRCGWPLWGLYQYEKYLERRGRVEKQFNISDDLSDLDKVVLNGETELVSLWVNNTDCPNFRKMVIDPSQYESTISLKFIDELLADPPQSDNCDLAGIS